jgi:hypothetical protein
MILYLASHRHNNLDLADFSNFSTLLKLGCLYRLNIKHGHFSHLFFDEVIFELNPIKLNLTWNKNICKNFPIQAGHVTEPESLVPLGNDVYFIRYHSNTYYQFFRLLPYPNFLGCTYIICKYSFTFKIKIYFSVQFMTTLFFF